MDIVIENKDYFYMVDNKIRDTMMDYEEKVLLPKARKLITDSGLKEFVDYPTEGYYYKTDGLKEYINIIRNIQNRKEVYDAIPDTKELDDLKKITGSKLFGTVVSDRNDSPIPRMKDIMTLTMEDKKLFPDDAHHPWTIPKILSGLDKYSTGNPNLVELAYLTKENECLVSSCETNILYREDVIISGASISLLFPNVHWNVDSAVEEMGAKLIDGYNHLIGSKMEIPTIDNFQEFDRIPEIPRVARLGYQMNTKEHYYWILDKNRNVFDKYSTDIITTENYK